MTPLRILFVCSGNICRSPTAEAVMRSLVSRRGLDAQIEVDSAGIGDWHAGERPDRRASVAARRRGIGLDGVARQVRPEDFADFDWLVAMDSSHYEDLRCLAPRGTAGKVRMFAAEDVPDPYYGGDEGFEHVLDVIEAGCVALLDELADGVRGGLRQG